MSIKHDDLAEIEVPHWLEIDTEIRHICSAKSDQAEAAPHDGSKRKQYVVMLTSGDGDGGKRATLAFSAACTAIAMDFDTRVFLIGDGSQWAYERASDSLIQPGFPPLSELIDSFMNLGGKIYLCAACDQEQPAGDHAHAVNRRRPKVQNLGLAPVLTHMVDSTTVTF